MSSDEVPGSDRQHLPGGEGGSMERQTLVAAVGVCRGGGGGRQYCGLGVWPRAPQLIVGTCLTRDHCSRHAVSVLREPRYCGLPRAFPVSPGTTPTPSGHHQTAKISSRQPRRARCLQRKYFGMYPNSEGGGGGVGGRYRAVGSYN
ncbi:hypothetical protein Pmani_036466 [Petrolisthes manimaculis]|uniref:Uncharacterized protein n=1 Tax=Petrolisthes manimaculis TaxID=1843537 RepID=A0AAE1NK39_9EUCA|nr:hypothetical protein Pmani_036466 [Petrolisthes manimaculis]